MRYKLLGPSGLRVSELCLGTMSFGEAWGFGADERESHRILGEFAEAGRQLHRHRQQVPGGTVGGDRRRLPRPRT
jgi:hypothetical protein